MIGWYVHHHGHGHLERARCIARALGGPVTGLSSLPAPGAPFADWLQLPPDDTATDAGDATAHGALHWAPVRDPASARRMAALTAWIVQARPRAVVVDVSVEAALTCRLAGVPVVVVAQPGDRTDEIHALAYRLADAVLAPWAEEVYAPAWLAPWRDKTVYAGAISRFDDRATTPSEPGVVLALSGAGGTWTGPDGAAPTPPDLPGWTWKTLAGGVTDAWPDLCRASVVVAHGGLNALAEVAAARRPAVVIPQDRPFGEQAATAHALQDASIVASAPDWPSDAQWPDLLAAAAAIGPAGWSRWSTGDGAARAAEVVRRVAAQGPSW